MKIVVNLDVMMARRKKGLTELAKEVDITLANLSILKNNKAKAIRFSTLTAICKALDCQPGDILEFVDEEETEEKEETGEKEENGEKEETGEKEEYGEKEEKEKKERGKRR